ncbi:hypothetical protein L596_001289 [Steinernema carpocapsae]|uniref:Uncharacterized protein n=1 Tax=Steinernema carpocapsae TaxID=34508 RepID=A0A4U8UKU3_STECR|nr:hypothetical protein L596_001289 [Steinernema carpocapsae]
MSENLKNGRGLPDANGVMDDDEINVPGEIMDEAKALEDVSDDDLEDGELMDDDDNEKAELKSLGELIEISDSEDTDAENFNGMDVENAEDAEGAKAAKDAEAASTSKHASSTTNLRPSIDVSIYGSDEPCSSQVLENRKRLRSPVIRVFKEKAPFHFVNKDFAHRVIELLTKKVDPKDFHKGVWRQQFYMEWNYRLDGNLYADLIDVKGEPRWAIVLKTQKWEHEPLETILLYDFNDDQDEMMSRIHVHGVHLGFEGAFDSGCLAEHDRDTTADDDGLVETLKMFLYRLDNAELRVSPSRAISRAALHVFEKAQIKKLSIGFCGEGSVNLLISQLKIGLLSSLTLYGSWTRMEIRKIEEFILRKTRCREVDMGTMEQRFSVFFVRNVIKTYADASLSLKLKIKDYRYDDFKFSGNGLTFNDDGVKDEYEWTYTDGHITRLTIQKKPGDITLTILTHQAPPAQEEKKSD